MTQEQANDHRNAEDRLQWEVHSQEVVIKRMQQEKAELLEEHKEQIEQVREELTAETEHFLMRGEDFHSLWMRLQSVIAKKNSQLKENERLFKKWYLEIACLKENVAKLKVVWEDRKIKQGN